MRCSLQCTLGYGAHALYQRPCCPSGETIGIVRGTHPQTETHSCGSIQTADTPAGSRVRDPTLPLHLASLALSASCRCPRIDILSQEPGHWAGVFPSSHCEIRQMRERKPDRFPLAHRGFCCGGWEGCRDCCLQLCRLSSGKSRLFVLFFSFWLLSTPFLIGQYIPSALRCEACVCVFSGCVCVDVLKAHVCV